MDMKFSGSGVLGTGEYEEVRVSGSARIQGSVRCRSFNCAGSLTGDGELNCRGEFHSSGSTHLNGALRADSAVVSGSLHCGALRGDREVQLSGSAHVEGKLSGGEVRASGRLKVAGDIEAEVFRSSGSLDCEGLLNAENAEIAVSAGSSVGAIGGGVVRIKGRPEGHLFGFGFYRSGGERSLLTVRESIEADEVELESTACPLVSGRRVVVGPGCRIDVVRYSESAESPASPPGFSS